MNSTLTQKAVKSVQLAAILIYGENMKTSGTSITAQGIANARLAEYENAIIENGVVIGYYSNGFKELPSFPKY